MHGRAVTAMEHLTLENTFLGTREVRFVVGPQGLSIFAERSGGTPFGHTEVKQKYRSSSLFPDQTSWVT